MYPGERRLSGLMIAHSFFVGLTTVLFETAASATFLSRWSAADLPFVYIVAAVLNAGCGVVYSRLRTRVPFATLMYGTLGALLLLVLGVRIAHAAVTGPFIAFGALVIYRLVASLTDLEYWAVASRIFDIGQARRLFSVVGTGEVVARAAGAFSIPLLVMHGGVANLMLWSAGSLGGCLLVLPIILAEAPVPARAFGDSRPVEPATDPETRRYLGLVVAVAVLATFGKYFVDFSFLEHLDRLAMNEKELATLLGVVAGVTQTLSLLLRVFVSRRILARIGVRRAVLVLPIAQALATAGVIAAASVRAPAVVFAFVLVNQGLYKALKHPIDNAAFKVLYQPLAAAQRLAAQIRVEVLITPLAVTAAAVVMLFFAHRYDDGRFAGLLLVVFACWTVAARAAGRRYEGMLALALRPSRDPPSDIGSAYDAARPNPTDMVELARLRDALHLETRRAMLLRDPGELAEARSRILELLAVLYERDTIRRVEAHLGHPSREKRALARELLEVLLRREDRAVLACLCRGAPCGSSARGKMQPNGS